MKAFAIIILSCVPLAAVSAWSVVELATVGSRVPRPPEAPSDEAQRAMVDAALARVEAEQAPADALAEADLFEARPPQALLDLPDDARLKPLAKEWNVWGEALQQTDAVLTAAAPTALGDLDAMKKAADDLEKQKTALGRSSARGAKPVIKAISDQINHLQTRIARVEQERKAAAQVALAQAALDQKEYARCIELCNEIEKTYGTILESTVAENVKRLRLRAQFWTDQKQFDADVKTADTPEARRKLLESFVAKYPDPNALTDAERKVLDQHGQELAAVVGQIEMTAKEHAASEAIAALRAALPATFAGRVAKASEIAATYPTAATRAALRGEVRGWLGELVPPKELDESPRLQEVETTRHEIVRGYFTQVNSPQGYKRYSTYEQSIHPVSEVGTYLASQLLGGPSASAPRRALTRYATARKALIDNLAQRQQWEAFAGTCEQLDRELAAYRAKPGSSQTPLSFTREAQFARDQLATLDWTQLAPLFSE